MLDLVKVQTVPVEQSLDCCHRVVAQVFVIDGVKLALIDQVADVRGFNGGSAGVRQKSCDTSDKAI